MPSRWHHAALVALVALAGCRDQPAVDDCGDSLAGLWSGGDLTLHVLDHGGRVELYSIDRAPDRQVGDVRESPPAFELSRAPGGVTGRRYLRRERDGRICHIDLPVELRACAGQRLTLAWRELVHLRWVDCEVTASPRWTEVTLTRERYLPPRR
jgi:hypothetical protein